MTLSIKVIHLTILCLRFDEDGWFVMYDYTDSIWFEQSGEVNDFSIWCCTWRTGPDKFTNAGPHRNTSQ